MIKPIPLEPVWIIKENIKFPRAENIIDNWKNKRVNIDRPELN